MLIEVRVSNINQLNEVLDLDVDIIGIGNEGCIHKGLGHINLEKMIDKIRSRGKKVRLVTPKIPQKSFFEVNKDLTQIIKSNTIDFLTINDYGLLYNLIKEDTDLSDIDVNVGRWLIFSPAVNEQFVELFQDFKDNRELDFNIVNQNKIDFLKKNGVSGIEINFLPDFIENTVSFLHKNKFRVNGHLKYLLISAARSCDLARILNLEKDKCHIYCDSIYNLSLGKIYKFPLDGNLSFSSFYHNPDESLKKRLQYYVIGNLVFIKSEYSIETVREKNIDSIILDRRAFSIEEINSLIFSMNEEDYYEKIGS